MYIQLIYLFITYIWWIINIFHALSIFILPYIFNINNANTLPDDVINDWYGDEIIVPPAATINTSPVNDTIIISPANDGIANILRVDGAINNW